MENSENSGFAIFNSVLGRQNRFAQSSSLALVVFPKSIQLVRSNLEMPHDQKPFPAGNPPLLSALTAEPQFAATVVWSVARNHSANCYDYHAANYCPRKPAQPQYSERRHRDAA
jgi:hypothetical protein